MAGENIGTDRARAIMMNWVFVAAGLIVHVIFLYAIFDIYFTSPLVHGMTPQVAPVTAPAKRLVLFVADGLRADKFFELDEFGKSRAPFLRQKIEKEGRWGVSHTRVPTESRPGHVALIAGFYEDVSAVAKGWKENPVEFDSTFNESRNTWSWGSPDILPMFAKGASGSHVFMKMYPAENEDFAGDNLANLDTWVFNEFKEFLQGARENKSLLELVNKDKIIFFLHLLGLDTNGHSHKPFSVEYLNNIRIVDDGVKGIVDLVEGFYDNDGKTAYIFTADHGMTNWGSHGAGHPSETLTPLVAWGAGISPAKRAAGKQGFSDDFSARWNLAEIERNDVNQADVAPLMASLIGIAFPMNSVGVLPLNYLDGSDEHKAKCLHANALEIVEQFHIKMAEKRHTTISAAFVPFEKLTDVRAAAINRIIHRLLRDESYALATSKSQELIDLALEGLNYYHNYDRFMLELSVTLGYVAWMCFTLILLLKNHTSIVHTRTRLELIEQSFWRSEKGIRIAALGVGAIVTLLLFVQSLPWTYYLYSLTPVALWYQVLKQLDVMIDVFHFVVDRGYVKQAVLTVVFSVLGVEILIATFFYREVITLLLLVMAVWPWSSGLRHNDRLLVAAWSVSCVVMSVFPLLPVVGREANYLLVYLAGVVALLALKYGYKHANVLLSVQVSLLTMLQTVLLIAAIVITYTTSSSISAKRGLPELNQIFSWVILVLSFLLPLFSSVNIYSRLMNIVLAFLPPYLLMSVAQEGFFFLALCLFLFTWLHLEHTINASSQFWNKKQLSKLNFVDTQLFADKQRYLTLSDVRCALIFLVCLYASFFGTGNIASLNSFEPMAVRCFLTIFNPFVMGALLMWKVLIPILLVSCAFNAIHVSVNIPTQSLFLLVLLISDFMALHFFFYVQDYGSWLEIGTSISHYVLVMSFICFLIILLALSKILTTFSINLMPITNKRK